MGIPVILIRQCLIDAVVEVFVVGKDDMATDIVELQTTQLVAAVAIEKWQTHKALGGHISGSKSTWSLVGVDDHPRRVVLRISISVLVWAV